MTRLVVTADAEADTNDILGHLEQVAGPRIAESYGRRFRSTVQRVIAAPSSGAPRPRLGAQSRIAIVYPYILIYEGDYPPETGSRNLTADRLSDSGANFGALERRSPMKLKLHLSLTGKPIG